jgi:DNA excision repair protein ERCC-4
MRAEPKPEELVAVVDSREQQPADMSPLRAIRGTLVTGDYSILGLENVVAVERKSLPDFLACCGRERERFEKEVQRLLGYPHRALVIETTWHELQAGNFARTQITANVATASVLSWIAQGLPCLLCGDHEQAGKAIAKLLFLAARRRWREARALIQSAETNS